MNRLKQLQQYGQSLWLDYIRRNLIISGELQRLIEEDGLRGITSNPTIFEKAIDGSNDYDAELRRWFAQPPSDIGQVYESLAIEDIRMAADLLRPVYEATEGSDGFVSLEVSPHLAHDTVGTVAEARRLWRTVERPNLMVKVPGTVEGVPAIEGLIAEGINVNVTLMFSLAHYEAVAHAYLRGLERAADPRRIASVASFFVSRVDTAVDRRLEEIGTFEALSLRGKIAIANAKIVYQRFREIFYGEPFTALRRRGARVQRPLWASTGTKNPAYSDVLYVEELIGPDTVNTMPPATLAAFRDHGAVPGITVERDLDQARTALDSLKGFGVNLDSVAQTLQAEGVASFAASFEKLIGALKNKRKVVLTDRARQHMTLGTYDTRVRQRLQTWRTADFGCRFWRKDYSLWLEKPAPELTDRMGWLTLPETMQEQVEDLTAFANEVKAEGIKHAVLLGMGGSSLAPEVFQRTFGNTGGYLELIVLDSTHPAAIQAVERRIDPLSTLFLVSSKSGTTTETLSFFHYFWNRVAGRTSAPGRHFVAITDLGTALEQLARDRRFRRIFPGPPDIGGRYSALSVFGLVPAALIGVDLKDLLDRAWSMAEACAFCVPEPDTPCFELGAALGELALSGRDKVTFITSPSLDSFPAWAEQLIAESTGKHGKGIVPITDEPIGGPEVYGEDRVFVYLRLEGDEAGELESKIAALESADHPVIRIELKKSTDVGQEFFRWEAAVAAAGAVIGIHPFNQPDVQLAKELAREAMASLSAGRSGREAAAQTGSGREPELVHVGDKTNLERGLQLWLQDAQPNRYVALQAYIARTEEAATALQNIQLVLRDRLRLATTLGYGPRFLHSTGQLHKGGPNSGLFLQLLDEPAADVAIPETNYSFGALIQAQALGDYHALKRAGRRVLRVHLGTDAAGGLRQLIEVLQWLELPRFSGTSAA